MSEYQLLCFILGSVYWFLCALVVHRVSTPIGVNGDGTKHTREPADWFMIATAPLWITLYAFIVSIEFLRGKY